jgi:hypothetical protein
MIQLIAITRITSCMWFPPARTGDVVWVPDERAARHLIERGFCKLPEVQEEPKAEEKAQEVKKNRCADPIARPSIVSPSSSGYGKARPWLVSAAVPVSPQRI